MKWDLKIGHSNVAVFLFSPTPCCPSRFCLSLFLGEILFLEFKAKISKTVTNSKLLAFLVFCIYLTSFNSKPVVLKLFLWEFGKTPEIRERDAGYAHTCISVCDFKDCWDS